MDKLELTDCPIFGSLKWLPDDTIVNVAENTRKSVCEGGIRKVASFDKSNPTTTKPKVAQSFGQLRWPRSLPIHLR